MNAHAHNSHSLETEFHQIASEHAAFKADSLPSKQTQPRLKSWAQNLIDFLTGAQPLSIREKKQKNGTSQWIVYETASDTQHVFETEQEVRIWLEKRY